MLKNRLPVTSGRNTLCLTFYESVGVMVEVQPPLGNHCDILCVQFRTTGLALGHGRQDPDLVKGEQRRGLKPPLWDPKDPASQLWSLAHGQARCGVQCCEQGDRQADTHHRT